MSVVYASTLDLPEAWFDELAGVDGVEVRRPGGPVDSWPADLRAEVDLLHTTDAGFDPAAFAHLRCVQLDTSGVDHVVGSPLWASDVPLVTLGGLAPVPMAEYTVMGLLALAHHLPELTAGRLRREWPPPAERLARYTPRPLPGSTVVIVGYGRIGREIGRLCRAFGMDVVGVRRSADAAGREQLDLGRSGGDDPAEVLPIDRLDDALARADWVVVVLPLTGATRGLIDAGRLDAIPHGAGFVNVARGGIVDEPALLERIRDGRIGGAVLDVFDDEPLPPDSPWWTEERVLLTPHVAGLAPAYLEGTLGLVSENLRRLGSGRPLLNEVDRERGY